MKVHTGVCSTRKSEIYCSWVGDQKGSKVGVFPFKFFLSVTSLLPCEKIKTLTHPSLHKKWKKFVVTCRKKVYCHPFFDIALSLPKFVVLTSKVPSAKKKKIEPNLTCLSASR